MNNSIIILLLITCFMLSTISKVMADCGYEGQYHLIASYEVDEKQETLHIIGDYWVAPDSVYLSEIDWGANKANNWYKAKRTLFSQKEVLYIKLFLTEAMLKDQAHSIDTHTVDLPASGDYKRFTMHIGLMGSNKLLTLNKIKKITDVKYFVQGNHVLPVMVNEDEYKIHQENVPFRVRSLREAHITFDYKLAEKNESFSFYTGYCH